MIQEQHLHHSHWQLYRYDWKLYEKPRTAGSILALQIEVRKHQDPEYPLISRRVVSLQLSTVLTLVWSLRRLGVEIMARSGFDLRYPAT